MIALGRTYSILHKLPRACKNCQRLKIRCLSSEGANVAPCRHCSRTNTTCIFGTSRQGQRPRAPAGKALLCQLQRIEHTLLTLHNVVESDTSNSSPHHVHKETILCEADTRSRSPTPVLPANDKAVSKVDPISNERWLDNHPEGYLDIMTLLGIEEMGILFNM